VTTTSQIARETQQETAGVATWTLDPAHTLVEFSGKHMMFTTVKDRFGAFSGELSVDEAHPERSRVAVEIDAASLDTRTERRDTHLRSADFLHVEAFPTITFASTRIDLPAGARVRPGLAFKVAGDLTIRGTSRPVVLDAEFTGEGTGPMGNPIKAFAAKTKLNRKDFGLTWNVVLETGGVLVGDEIKIEVETQANPKA
jgi:polyisoprenoid-binding protein YceI